jgi:pantetheine-phosphate adenylyltransferase
VLIRGVRGLEDFSYEFELSMMNKTLDPGIETIFMTTDPEYFVIRSSSIKELASFKGDLHGMVPA